MSSEQILFDDDNHELISYKPRGRWVRQSDVAGAFNSTVTRSMRKFDSASFNFTGNKIEVFGVLGLVNAPHAPHLTRYDLDDRPSVVFSAFAPTDFDMDTAFKSIRFYESPELEGGTHTLTITNMMDKNTVMLDYFEVTKRHGYSMAASNQMLSPSTDTADDSSGQPQAPSMAVIAGACVGCIALIAGLAVVYFLWRGRKNDPLFSENRKHDKDFYSENSTGTSSQTP